MNLIDRDAKQLQDAVTYIDDLKRQNSTESSEAGQVHVHNLEDADPPLAASWMVLEV